MTAVNTYATLAEFKAFVTNRGATSTPITDTADDAVIDQLLEQASRFLDSETARQYYPSLETRYFDLPSGRQLFLDDDLLAVTSITNGDGTSITSTDYVLESRNNPPYWAIKLKESSSIVWEADSSGNSERVIAVAGFWGYHNDYTRRGWRVGSTLAEDLDTSEVGWDMTSGTLFSAGQIIKVDNEIAIISSVATNTVTIVSRAENGTTAATHLTGGTVYIWRPMDEVRNAALELANNAYHRRFGQSLRSEETITAAGIVLTPREVPHLTKEFIKTYQRYV